MKPKLLIVDDDDEIRTQMKWSLNQDYEILQAGDRIQAVDQARTAKPAVVLLDLGLPPNPASPDEGLATLAELLAIDPLTKIVIISGQGEKTNALQAVGAGAYDFLGKPVEMVELKLLLKRCFARMRQTGYSSPRWLCQGIDHSRRQVRFEERSSLHSSRIVAS